MEKNEIQASWDLATWLQDTQAELAHLDSEEDRKKIYIDKLLIAIVAAKAHEDKVWEIYFDSATVLNDALDAREAVRARYAAEKHRRDEENQLLDVCLRIFDESVANMDTKIRGKVDDYHGDKSFDDKNESRVTDIHDASAGKVAQQVAHESRSG